jgi:16S rRNA (uracil1498-N3)-methyltransferase
MRISRLHIGARLVEGEEISLDKSQSHYLKNVLRLKSGAAVVLFNGVEAVDYQSRLIFEAKQAKVYIESAQPLDNESRLDSEIIQGLARNDHLDWMIQKTTELGVTKISIFNAERSQTPLKPAQQEKKLAHWKSVASSACEQCGRAILPKIAFYSGLEHAVAASAPANRLLLDFDGEPLTSALLNQQPSLSLLLGPEGGLNPREIEQALATGFRRASLGRRVLRFETAATAALAIAQSVLGDL